MDNRNVPGISAVLMAQHAHQQKMISQDVRWGRLWIAQTVRQAGVRPVPVSSQNVALKPMAFRLRSQQPGALILLLMCATMVLFALCPNHQSVGSTVAWGILETPHASIQKLTHAWNQTMGDMRIATPKEYVPLAR